MAILTDTELLLGLSRHLQAYTMSPERAALGTLEFGGQVLDVAFRLRGSTSSSAPRVQAIAYDIGLGPIQLKAVIETMASLEWVSVQRDNDGAPLSITETIPTPGGLVGAAPRVLDILTTSSTERAALAILRATTLQPLLIEDAMTAGVEAVPDATGAEVIASDGIRHLGHTGLLRHVRSDDGREVLYNPNVWIQGDSITDAALRAADARATGEITALLEELTANPGLPEVQVRSTEGRWIAFAVSQGLVQRSVIQTSEGQEKAFLFTPHLVRDPFGGTAGDASGQVRQLVGSMIYAATFARFRLDDPAVFLQALISRGIAGNVSNINTDYPMLEKAGIVRVISGRTAGRYSLELLQSEVAEDACRLLVVRESSSGEKADIAALRAQRSYIHIDRERAKLALTTPVDEVEQARLIAALRQVSVRRTFRSQ